MCGICGEVGPVDPALVGRPPLEAACDRGGHAQPYRTDPDTITLISVLGDSIGDSLILAIDSWRNACSGHLRVIDVCRRHTFWSRR